MDPADSASRQLSLLAEEAGWEKNVLRRAFLNSLNENIKCELATKELPKSLSALINLCISLDDYMREFSKRSGDGRRPVGGAGAMMEFPSLMWKGEEEEPRRDEEGPGFSSTYQGRRQRTGECFLCGKRGHFVDSCPVRVKELARQ